MKEKLKAIFDSKVTWSTISIVVGTVFGAHSVDAVNALGALVMAVL